MATRKGMGGFPEGWRRASTTRKNGRDGLLLISSVAIGSRRAEGY